MYDLIVIGGGPAGYAAALEAVRRGLSTVLFEKEFIGGTCLNRGCVPTKFLAHIASIYANAGKLAKYGMFSERVVDFQKLYQRRIEIVHSLREGLVQQMKQKGIVIIPAEAHVLDQNHIICKEQVFETKNVLIASGSVPADKRIQNAVSSDELLEMQELPGKLHILGGGTAAVEFACIFRMFGSDVTVSIRADHILTRWDREISSGLEWSMKRKGIRIQKKCCFDDLKTDEDALILSVLGRKPNTAGLPVKLLEFGPDGGVVTDSVGRTKTGNIFAAGDVVSASPQLAHTGMEQGQRVARYLAGVPIEQPSAVVRCMYMDQEAASVGITEADAKICGIEVICAKQTMYANARTVISAGERGFIKVVAQKESGKILGAQLLCERAGDIIAELALAVNNGLTVRDMLASVRPHPSYCEAVTDVLQILEEKML